MKSFSILSTIKCMEILDKLKWFRKMKAKSQLKHQGGPAGINHPNNAGF